MGPASIKTLAGGCSDAGRISKGWELRQINPDVLKSETWLGLDVDTCHSYTSLSFTDFFSQSMKNENVDLRSSSCRPDVNGLPNPKVKSSLLSPCRRYKRSCPENWRIKREALSRPGCNPWLSQEEEEMGRGLHQAQLKGFDHHMLTWRSHRAHGQSWGSEAPLEVVCPQSRGTSGDTLVSN